MTMREEVDLAVEKIEQHFGPVDILVNNAGTISVGPVETMTIDDYRDSINTHFWGPYFATTAVLPSFQRRRHGRIVNISSIGGKIGVPHLVPYGVGKFALTGFSQDLRSELLKDNIYVTTILLRALCAPEFRETPRSRATTRPNTRGSVSVTHCR